ncbi:MAG TPA: folylpolyglutamate synthase/dihydrofolate synthase family protein [Frankiaceae bacterium]|nr:folylpolyglutamate synthase/dihydrofolate synthase family protein [Frankiaceae bacterium]
MTDPAGPAGATGSADPASEGLGRIERALAGRFPHLMRPDLSRMTQLVDLLGHPEQSFPSIHLTGTNGKTSTARMIDALFRGFGLRPGRYTSPHLESLAERIAIDGRPASAEVLNRAYDDVHPYVELVDASSPEPVTYFELMTAMAFSAFADAPVDIGVIEVGMGGTWDATNVIDGAVQVITPIALDHPELGSTLSEVATEKAGILRPDGTVILGLQSVEAAEVLLRRASELGTAVAREGIEFGVTERRLAVGGQMLTIQGLGGTYDEIFLGVQGQHQAHNAACALAAVEAFFGAGEGRQLDVETVRRAFADVESPGRLEIVRSSPTVLVDGAHNPAGVAALVEALRENYAFEKLVGVVGILSDKDASAMLAALEPVLHTIVLTQINSPRATSADELAAVAVEFFDDDRVEVVPRLDDALETAVAIAEEDADQLSGVGVLVTGSLLVVGEARRLLGH